MRVSRRNLLVRLSAGATVAAVLRPSERMYAAGESGGRSVIHLDRNENPYGPSPNVIATIQQEAESVNRYPSAAIESLREEIARAHGVDVDRVVVGCGSRAILRIVVSSLAAPRKNVVMAAPGFDFMRSLARRAGRETIAVPLNAENAHDLPTIRAKIDDATGFVYICNPNNPTGTVTPRRAIEGFLAQLADDIPVIVDEAYHPYVRATLNYPSLLDGPVDDGRLIVVRTFSTIHGLAGMRVGYAIATVPTARRIALLVDDDVTGLSAKAAIAALQDADYVSKTAARNADDRQEFLNQANARMLRSIDSVTNFVMLDVGGPPHAVTEHFVRHHIAVGEPVMSNDRYIRVSLGTPDEMREFWRVWDLMPMRTMSM
jgi:histidinol-phosphate aminotransferase